MNSNIFDFIWDSNYNEKSYCAVDKVNNNTYNFLLSEWNTNNIILSGPKFSGKTHIGKIWARKNNAFSYIDHDLNESLLNRSILVDSIERIISDYEVIMHLFYLSSNCNILWIKEDATNLQNINLIDLKTRFLSALELSTANIDDTLFKRILIKRSLDFGLEMKDDCAEYLARRAPITFHAINEIAIKIHSKCLLLQKPITLPLIQHLNLSFD